MRALAYQGALGNWNYRHFDSPGEGWTSWYSTLRRAEMSG
jgi:hypothetical protein